MSVSVKTKNNTPKLVAPYEFLERVLGKNITIANEEAYNLAMGIQLSCIDVVTDTVSNTPDDQVYFHFCPIEDGKFYVLLTFFPEIGPRNNEDYIRITRLIFKPAFFQQWDYNILLKKQPFRFDRSSEQVISLPPCCFEPINHLSSITQENMQDFSLILQRKESAIFLLRISLDAYLNPNDACCMPACSFLSNSKEREKVMNAYHIIMDHLEEPKTIRTLSRMVGMNECYLKKGFKVTFGKTIHEFQQFQRIEKAKELLKEGKYSVNEVAFMMGFGSASHFSSSFKKIAGMKPCELLG